MPQSRQLAAIMFTYIVGQGYKWAMMTERHLTFFLKTGKYKSPLSKNRMKANITDYDLSYGMLTRIE